MRGISLLFITPRYTQQILRIMNTISINYSLKWKIKDFPHYQFTQCGKLFNCKTNKIKKQCYNSGSIGYWIDRKFITLENLRKKLVKIKEIEIPF